MKTDIPKLKMDSVSMLSEIKKVLGSEEMNIMSEREELNSMIIDLRSESRKINEMVSTFEEKYGSFNITAVKK
ncbi:hypothetical protein AYI68_g255 [Smittium mucronatum]|uniref:Uncharacterized protein n=1 Tax=Smittium mucronatum TaxID=133383 RepID=A0A1R0H8V3_9FUNG|nr:hypothetical protein AYI68_g255 [Smittium mucronatum]